MPTKEMATDRLEKFEELTASLIRKLDVALPKANSTLAFHSARQGGASEDYGPNFMEELETLREMLELPNPAATERDYWPEDWCRHCDGSGKVMPTKGIHPYGQLQDPGLYLASVPDEEKAVRILLETKAQVEEDRYGPTLKEIEQERPSPEKAREIIANLEKDPFYLKGSQIFWLRYAYLQQFMETEATFVYIRGCVWPVFDACPECKGTAKRGLPEMTPWEPDQEHHGPWPKGEVIFNLDRHETWKEFEQTWNRYNKRD